MTALGVFQTDVTDWVSFHPNVNELWCFKSNVAELTKFKYSRIMELSHYTDGLFHVLTHQYWTPRTRPLSQNYPESHHRCTYWPCRQPQSVPAYRLGRLCTIHSRTCAHGLNLFREFFDNIQWILLFHF